MMMANTEPVLWPMIGDSVNNDEEKESESSESDAAVGMAMANTIEVIANNNEYWIGDTGATTHLKKCKLGMIDSTKAQVYKG